MKSVDFEKRLGILSDAATIVDGLFTLDREGKKMSVSFFGNVEFFDLPTGKYRVEFVRQNKVCAIEFDSYGSIEADFELDDDQNLVGILMGIVNECRVESMKESRVSQIIKRVKCELDTVEFLEVLKTRWDNMYKVLESLRGYLKGKEKKVIDELLRISVFKLNKQDITVVRELGELKSAIAMLKLRVN